MSSAVYSTAPIRFNRSRVTICPMRFRIPKSTLTVFLLIAWLLSLSAPVSAQSSDAAQLLARINTLRTQNGLLPLDVSSLLTTSAQRHSDDMAQTGNIDHTGSDGSTIDSRIRATGYGHWRNFGLWGENIYGGQMADVDAAWNFWINSQVHRANLLNPRYREVGLGVGKSDNGTYYTLNFGAQPNVLPFFVTGSAPIVTLLLTNENDITTGEGVAIMGQATQVRVAEGTETSSAGWQPWASSIPFQLSNAPGQHTITVEYRDDLKRGTKTSRTFNVSDLAAAPTPTPTPTAITPTVTPTRRATATIAPTTTGTGGATSTAVSTPTVMSTPTIAPTTTGTRVATPTVVSTPPVMSTPTIASTTTGTRVATPPQTATSTPTVIAQPTDTPAPAATPTPLPTDTPEPPTATVAPSATPGPITSPAPRVTITSQLIAANLATYPAASRLTPPAPRAVPPERPLLDDVQSPVSSFFAILLSLQAIAIAGIGAAVVIRLRRRS